MVLKKGLWVEHTGKPQWGLGIVVSTTTDNKIAVEFVDAGLKTMDLTYATLEAVTAPKDGKGNELTLQSLRTQKTLQQSIPTVQERLSPIQQEMKELDEAFRRGMKKENDDQDKITYQ